MGIYQTLAKSERDGKFAALVTVIRTQGSVPRHVGSKMVVFEDGSCEGTIGGGVMESQVIERAIRAIHSTEPETLSFQFHDPARGDVGVCGGEMEVFVEPIAPSPTVIVIGAGHVGREVAALADWLGFQVMLSDDRPEFAEEGQSGQSIETHHGPMAELPTLRSVHRQTYVVLTTRDVNIDVEGLPSLLETQAAYIGVIGSKRRWETAKEMLLERGVPEEALAQVHSPMGLDIKAETPREIALSVMSQIVSLRNKGQASK